MRRIGVVTTSRADFGIYVPVLRAIAADEDLDLRLFVSGSHLCDAHGRTERLIEAEGFAIDHRVPVPMDTDTPQGVTRSIGQAVAAFGEALAADRPDLLVVLGDRFEMAGAALAALPLRIPVAHLHGGETSQGAIDESLRHCITKLSHLHFVSHPDYRRRVIRMGEQPDRVIVSGAPALDVIRDFQPIDRSELGRMVGMPLDQPYLLVTFHPVTLEVDRTAGHVNELFGALGALNMPMLISYPNADPAGLIVRRAIDEYVDTHPDTKVPGELGQAGYFSQMHHAAAMVGNSSSGIIEAASFGLPVVNIGDRQRGRLHGANVIDVPCEQGAIIAAVKRSVSDEFRASIANLVNPYGDGRAASRIVDVLRSVELGPGSVIKPFYDGLPDAQ
jgi:UDP-hydrolysing UDP-N-acetyl-D-glucosamine 2-epimerase